MNPYAFFRRHLPASLVDALVIVTRAALIILILLYYDYSPSQFAYLKN